MQTIKEQLIREIELYDVSIDGFSYIYEVNKFKEKIDEMHGSIAQGSLISTYYAYSVGQKNYYFLFFHR